MALIKCYSCGRGISSLAEVCPACGVKFRPRLTPVGEDIAMGKHVVKLGLILAVSVLIAIVFAVFVSYLQTSK